MAPQSRDLIQELNDASTDDTETKLRVVRSLKNEIIGSQSKKQYYLELGAVPQIVQLLAAQQEKKLTIQAAATLGSFAYHNDAGVQAVVDSGGIAHLLKTLSSEDEKVVEAGVRSLKMIFQSPISPRDMIFVHPAFDRLVALLSNPKKTFAEDAAIIFAKCCDTKAQQQQLMRLGSLTGISKLLVTQSPSRQVNRYNTVDPRLTRLFCLIKAAALEAMISMSAQNVEVCESLMKLSDVRSALPTFTRNQNSRMRLMSCSVLTNIYRSLSEQDTALLTFREQKRILQVLVKLLLEPSVQEEVPSILANLTADRLSLQKAAFEVDAVVILCGFLTKKNEIGVGFRVGILKALAAICHNLPECRQQIIDLKGIQSIISSLESPSSEICCAAAYCIQNMTATVRDLNYDWVTESILPLTKLLNNDSIDIKACAALCNLVYEINMAKVIVIENFLGRMVELTYSDEPQLVQFAAWAFKNLTHKLPNEQRPLVLQGMPWDHVRMLIQHDDDSVQASALTFLQNICSSDTETIQTVIEWSQGTLLGVIREKLDDIEASQPNVISAALAVVSNISTGTSEHQEAIMSSGIPQQLLSCLGDQRSEKIRCTAVWCVINLIWRDELPLANDGGDGARDRATKLRDLGIETELQNMSGDESLDVRERVRTALSFFSV